MFKYVKGLGFGLAGFKESTRVLLDLWEFVELVIGDFQGFMLLERCIGVVHKRSLSGWVSYTGGLIAVLRFLV